VSPAATLLTIAGLHWAAMISPGPNVLLVANTGMARGRRAALAAGLGVAAGAIVLTLAALVGLGFLVARAAWLETGLRLVGAAYLVYLGIQIWRSAHRPIEIAVPDPSAPEDRAHHFRRGLLTNLTNPKAAVFYGSILTPVLASGAVGWVAPAAVLVVALDSATFHCGLAVVFARPRVRGAYARAKTTIDHVVGAALVAVGVRLGLPA
jgi:threonine efflux protein